MRISIACDHAGYELKVQVQSQLQSLGHEVVDFGTNSTSSVDFIDHVYPAALQVSEAKTERAILIDGAGYPSGIVANMLPGVYAAVANDLFSARLSREHSNANVLCLGGKVVGGGIAAEIVATWLKTEFAGGKYAARVDKVVALSKKYRRSMDVVPRSVLTVQDIRDALVHRESLIIDEKTIMTPSVIDLVR